MIVATRIDATGAAPIGPVEKLVEYRTAHYAAQSEAARYFTNTPARVQFRFANPIICDLRQGVKVIRVGDSAMFQFRPGDILYVPPGKAIDVDLSAASADWPIACNCIEIETERVEATLGRINEYLSSAGGDGVSLDWQAYTLLRGGQAAAIDLSSIMALFQGRRDVFTDLRIEAALDDLLLRILQARTQQLVRFGRMDGDGGIHAAARQIRNQLCRRDSTEELARVAGLSESTLYRRFRTVFGTTPARFANRLRIDEAKRRLRNSDDPTEVLAFALGFTDASHFGRTFRKATGESPAGYRRRRRGADCVE